MARRGLIAGKAGPVSVAVMALALAHPASAQSGGSSRARFDISEPRLVEALDRLGQQASADLLFSPADIGEIRTVPVRGRMTVDEALHRLLEGTPFTFRRSADGAFLIVPAAAEQPAMPDILVVGRKTQNLDIPRTENDIQIYQVVTAKELAASHATTVEDYFRSRISTNMEVASPIQQPTVFGGSPRSEISVRAQGENTTLILIDGARMPRIPSAGYFYQPDLNALPIEAVDRVEVVTQTSGGIYGPGAMSGVVNVIMRHDYSGFDAAAQIGPTLEGGGSTYRAYGRAGFSSANGGTQIDLAVGISRRNGLLVGDRDYEERVRARRIANAPDTTLAGTFSADGVRIYSGATPLTLKSPNGPIALGTNSALLPRGSDGLSLQTLSTSPGDLAALAQDQTGADQSLVTATRTKSILFNARQRLTDHIEAFVDLIALQNEGQANRMESPIQVSIAAGSPINPFNQSVGLTFFAPGVGRLLNQRIREGRVSAGLIAQLGRGWSAEGHVAIGTAEVRQSSTGTTFSRPAIVAALAGAPGGRPALDPFGNWSQFMSALRAYALPYDSRLTLRNRMTDVSARIAGSLVDLPAGPVALTVAAEQRDERTAGATSTIVTGGTTVQPAPNLPFGDRTRSLYGELRLPLLAPPDDGRASRPMLELQLASRYDWAHLYRDALPSVATGGQSLRTNVFQQAFVGTGGAKFRPVPGLLVRASLATGAAPTTMSVITLQSTTGPALYADPDRGGRLVGSEGTYQFVYGATPRIVPELSQSLSAGIVLTEDGGRLPRLSIDASRIVFRRQLALSSDLIPYILANEATLAGRITRAPLSAVDAAAGYRGGVITAIDASDLAVARAEVTAVDFGLDYHLRSGADDFTLAAKATWSGQYRIRSNPLAPWQDLATVRWRGNASAGWHRGAVDLGIAVQVVGPYPSYNSYDFDSTKALAAALALSTIPAQVYFDLTGGVRLPVLAGGGQARPLELRVGLLNIFDRKLPLAPSMMSASGYGDARGRRVDIVLAAHF